MDIDSFLSLKKCLICESKVKVWVKGLNSIGVNPQFKHKIKCRNGCMFANIIVNKMFNDNCIARIDIFGVSMYYDCDRDLLENNRLMLDFLESKVSYWKKDFRYIAEILERS